MEHHEMEWKISPEGRGLKSGSRNHGMFEDKWIEGKNGMEWRNGWINGISGIRSVDVPVLIKTPLTPTLNCGSELWN